MIRFRAQRRILRRGRDLAGEDRQALDERGRLRLELRGKLQPELIALLGTEALDQSDDTKDASRAEIALALMDETAERTDALASSVGTSEDVVQSPRRGCRPILACGAMATGLLARVLAEQLPVLDGKDAYVAGIPLDPDRSTNVPRRHRGT